MVPPPPVRSPKRFIGRKLQDDSFVAKAREQPVIFASNRMLGYSCCPRFCTACWEVALGETPRGRCCLNALQVMRLLGVLAANLSFFQVGPWRQLVWLSAAALPTAVLYFCLLNRQLLWRLLTDFEALYVLGNAVVLVVFLALEFRDVRIVALMSLVPSFSLIALVDALPPGAIRKRASVRFYVVNLVFLIVLWAQFYTGVGLDRHVTIRVSDALTFSVVNVAWRAATTLIIFGLRNLRSRVLYPDCLVVLKSRIETTTNASGEHELVSMQAPGQSSSTRSAASSHRRPSSSVQPTPSPENVTCAAAPPPRWTQPAPRVAPAPE